MSNQFRKLTKDAKKMIKRLDSDRGLTIRRNFDLNTSVYSRKNDREPLAVFSAKGDYSVSVLKLTLWILLAASATAAVLLAVKSVADRLRMRKLRRGLNGCGCGDYCCDETGEDDIPF